MITVKGISRYKGETMCVVIDNGSRTAEIYLNRDIIAQGGLAEGMTVTSAQLRSLMALNERRRARERALYLLESREHSFRELYDKLIKNYSEDTAQSVCDELLERGLIDDRRFAENMVRSLINRKYGIMRIRQELYARGVDRDITAEVTEDIGEDTSDALRVLIKQKYMPKLEENADKVKSALARRGYTYAQIRDAVEEALDEE